jgi:hypothetical protein
LWQQRQHISTGCSSRRILCREIEAAGLRAVPDGADDGYGHYVFGTRAR